MLRRFSLLATPALLLLGLCALFGPDVAADPPDDGVRVGMANTFFHDLAAPLIEIATKPFGIVMREACGIEGRLVSIADPAAVVKQLRAKELHFGVFHSFEYAWLRQQHPELKPLAIAVNEQARVQAFLMVRKDTPPENFAALKGKTLSIPKRTKEHCRLYVETCCTREGRCDAKAFFAKVVHASSVEEGLDDLLRKKVDAVVVDGIGLEFYRDLKPGCANRVTVLQKSQDFPPPVIAYWEGGVEGATLTRVRNGLLRTKELEIGQEMLKLWKVRAFETVPQNYQRSLDVLLKTYPAPEGAKLSKR